MSNISEFLIDNSKGLIKSEKQINIILFIIVSVLIIASAILVFISFDSGNIEKTNYNPLSGYGGKELPDNYR